MINYEDEFYMLIKKNLKKRYNTLNDIDTFEIFILRYSVLNELYLTNKNFNKYKENICSSIKSIIDFLKYELNLPNPIIYKNYKFVEYINDYNSLNNIINNYIFEYGFKKYCKVENKMVNNLEIIYYYLSTLISLTKKDINIPKRNKYYNDFLKFNLLQRINTKFNCIPQNIEYYINDVEYNNYKFHYSYDTLLLNKINNSKINIYKDSICEKDIENYYKHNLNQLKEGLQLIKTQYKLKEGIIDILAKDTKDTIYIIELKIKIDKRLPWQIHYYYQEIQKKFSNNNVQVIVVSPKLPKYIIDSIKIEKDKITFHEI